MINGVHLIACISLQQTGKALRTILVDGGDLVPITEGMYTLREMLDNKIKAAQTMGRIYVDSTNLADKVIRQ